MMLCPFKKGKGYVLWDVILWLIFKWFVVAYSRQKCLLAAVS